MSADTSIAEWVKAQVGRKTPAGRCVAFVLRHVSPTRQSQGDIERVEVPEKVTKSFTLEAANYLLGAADRDAGALGGPQTYTIGAVFEGSVNPLVRHTFRCSAPEVEEGSPDPSVSEPATPQGHVAQMMRHNEALVRMATQGTQRTIDSLSRLLSQRDEMVVRYQSKELQRIEQMEELASAKHEREMARTILEQRERRKDELLDMVLPLVPTLANKLTGVKLLPGGVQDGDGIKALLSSITERQVDQLTQILTQPQQILLMQMFQEMRKTTTGTELATSDAKPEGDS